MCIELKITLMFPRNESHYTRAKSTNEYLSPYLNIHTDLKCILITFITNKFYRKICLRDFPNLKFKRSTDTCKVCDRLSAILRSKNSESR